MGIQRPYRDLQAQWGGLRQCAAAQCVIGPVLCNLAPVHLGMGLRHEQPPSQQGQPRPDAPPHGGPEKNKEWVHGGSPAVGLHGVRSTAGMGFIGALEPAAL